MLMKNYHLENNSDGVIVLRNGTATVQINKNSKIVISESAIELFKDQIAVLSKEKNMLKMYPVGANVVKEKKAEVKVEKEIEAKIEVEKEVEEKEVKTEEKVEEAKKKLEAAAKKAAKIEKK
jgi:hypothetical protein